MIQSIRPKNIVITGPNSGNVRTSVLKTIQSIAPQYMTMRSVTTCEKSVIGEKAEFYTRVTRKEFRLYHGEGKLFAGTFLGEHRMFAILKEEYEQSINSEIPFIVRLDFNGIKDLYRYHSLEELKDQFCIVALMPSMTSRREAMQYNGVPHQEALQRIQTTELTEQNFFRTDRRAECITGTVNAISRESNFLPLAESIVEYSTGKTERLIIPKSFTFQ